MPKPVLHCFCYRTQGLMTQSITSAAKMNRWSAVAYTA